MTTTTWTRCLGTLPPLQILPAPPPTILQRLPPTRTSDLPTARLEMDLMLLRRLGSRTPPERTSSYKTFAALSHQP